MLDNNEILQLSATDLAGHLSCIHLTQPDAEVARGARAKPKSWDPLLEILRKRGTCMNRLISITLKGPATNSFGSKVSA